VVFAAVTGACALLGGVAQVSQNLASSRSNDYRGRALTHVAQEVNTKRCRRSEGGVFQKNQVIPEDGGISPTSCYINEFGEWAFVAYENGKLTVKEVFSTPEVNAKMSQIKGEKKK
jgi:hypothetical protein